MVFGRGDGEMSFGLPGECAASILLALLDYHLKNGDA